MFHNTLIRVVCGVRWHACCCATRCPNHNNISITEEASVMNVNRSAVGPGGVCAAFVLCSIATTSHATLVDISPCNTASAAVVACEVTTTPPNPVQADPNNGLLLAWDEQQNLTLASDLRIDRVADETAPFIREENGAFFIVAGTIVSSHYLQWDPLGSSGTVEGTVNLDSTVYGFITDTGRLADTDALLGLPGFDYNDFGARGLEAQDFIEFAGSSVNVRWTASSPGDWTRLLTAFSPGGGDGGNGGGNGGSSVPEPSTLGLLVAGLLGTLAARRRRT
jgi:hypothetical protein